MIKIVVDVFSGDNPLDLIKGTADAVEKYGDVHIIMPGDPAYLEKELNKYSYDRSRLEILPALEIIENNESPTMAIRQKKNSTLVRGATLLRDSADVGGMISAGSTGAILCCGIFIVGRIRGIERPALAPVLPTADGGSVCLIDCGANAECRPQYLSQFALLGTGMMRSVCGVENPRVALVNMGVEDHKGSILTVEAAKMISRMPVNFVGNMEAREALSGNYDVLVCDGFVGNVLLKSIEGTAKLTAGKIREAAARLAPAGSDLGYLDEAIQETMSTLDYESNGGAWLLGCNKPIEKIHGAANAHTIPCAVGQMRSMILADMVGGINAQLKELSHRN